MSNAMIGLLCIVILFVLLAMKMWVGMAMALAGFIGLVLMRGFDQAWTSLFNQTFNNVASYSLSVIPMFVFMGCIIAETEIGANLFRCLHKWLGRLRGGLAYATVVATGLLGAITGSQLTGAIVMSKVALPEMERVGYKETLSCGSIAAASPLGILIPPSTAFILYGLLTEVSIGKLFVAGVLPGILTIITFSIKIFILCKRDKDLGPAMTERPRMSEKLKSTVHVLPIMILFVLVIVGIYAGWFTATEAGAIGAFGALIIAFASRQMGKKELLASLRETAKLCGMIMLQMVGTYVFSAAMTVSRLPAMLGNFVGNLGLPPFLVMIAIIILYLILGCFLPEFPMIMLTVPILYPVAQAMNFDLVWFGVMIVIVMCTGMMTPPVGMIVFSVSGITKRSVGMIFKGVAPFVIAELVVIILMMIFPQIATILPNLM